MFGEDQFLGKFPANVWWGQDQSVAILAKKEEVDVSGSKLEAPNFSKKVIKILVYINKFIRNFLEKN